MSYWEWNPGWKPGKLNGITDARDLDLGGLGSVSINNKPSSHVYIIPYIQDVEILINETESEVNTISDFISRFSARPYIYHMTEKTFKNYIDELIENLSIKYDYDFIVIPYIKDGELCEAVPVVQNQFRQKG